MKCYLIHMVTAEAIFEPDSLFVMSSGFCEAEGALLAVCSN